MPTALAGRLACLKFTNCMYRTLNAGKVHFYVIYVWNQLHLVLLSVQFYNHTTDPTSENSLWCLSWWTLEKLVVVWCRVANQHNTQMYVDCSGSLARVAFWLFMLYKINWEKARRNTQTLDHASKTSCLLKALVKREVKYKIPHWFLSTWIIQSKGKLFELWSHEYNSTWFGVLSSNHMCEVFFLSKKEHFEEFRKWKVQEWLLERDGS